MSGIIIEDSEGHDIRRNALLGDWAQVRSLIDNIAQREGFAPALILLEARDQAGSNVLHYAVQKDNAGKFFPTQIPFIVMVSLPYYSRTMLTHPPK